MKPSRFLGANQLRLRSVEGVVEVVMATHILPCLLDFRHEGVTAPRARGGGGAGGGPAAPHPRPPAGQGRRPGRPPPPRDPPPPPLRPPAHSRAGEPQPGQPGRVLSARL